MRSGSPPTLWWLLMVADGPHGDARLDDVRVERALGQKVGIGKLVAVFEHLDEGDDDEAGIVLRFLRVVDSFQVLQEAGLRVGVDGRRADVLAEARR